MYAHIYMHIIRTYIYIFIMHTYTHTRIAGKINDISTCTTYKYVYMCTYKHVHTNRTLQAARRMYDDVMKYDVTRAHRPYPAGRTPWTH